MNQDDLSQEQIDQVEHLREAAQIGMEAEAFRNSGLGQWIITKARAEKTGVIKQLILADATDAKAVADLQGKAVLLGLFEEWLDQAIVDGNQALQFFKNYDD